MVIQKQCTCTCSPNCVIKLLHFRIPVLEHQSNISFFFHRLLRQQAAQTKTLKH